MDEEKKRWKGTVARYDLVLKDHEYYQELSIKPGFEFWNCLVKYKDKIKSLKTFLPETLLTDERV